MRIQAAARCNAHGPLPSMQVRASRARARGADAQLAASGRTLQQQLALAQATRAAI